MRWALALLLAVLCVAACSFSPDLSRFASCDADGACPSGFTCLASESRCIPDCGERGPGPCVASVEDGGTDAGPGEDAGVDGGPGDADAGMDGGVDGGVDGGDAGEVLAINQDSLPAGLEGAAYTGQLSATGGTPPYAFTVTPATLPAGFSANAAGEVSGTPGVDGAFYLAVQVTDSSRPSRSAFGSVPLLIRPKLRLAGPGTLADAPLNAAYEDQLSATGGTPPYRFTLAEGSSLPSGLRLEEGGRVAGTASGQETTVRFTAQVTDSSSPPQVATRELEVTTFVPALLGYYLLTRSLPDARSGTGYSYTLRNHGGAQWSVNGTLPPNLSFNASTGTLSGEPMGPGGPTTYTFIITLANGLGGTIQRQVSIRVDVRD